MAGGLLAMPLLMINMGGEMIYILEQRLQAQNIPQSKSQKVLVDVVKTMYSPRFTAELFKPQEMYSNQATRQVFDRLAHSSIMRLNQSSMDKLYDLMFMGFKHQMTVCTSPDQLLQITLNHLNSILRIVPSDVVTPLLEETILQITTIYGKLSLGDFYLLKQQLCNFFQSRRVKVSLFLQEGIQNLDGVLVIPVDGPVGTGVEIPGKIRYFDANGRETDETTFDIQSSVQHEPVSTAPLLERDPSSCSLGMNLYSITRGTAAEPSKTPAEMAADAEKSGASAPPAKKASKCTLKATATDEMNLLADLLGSSAKDCEEIKPFKISLFGNDDADYDSKSSEVTVPMITIDATSDRKSLKAQMDELDLGEKKLDDKKGGDDDDLLDLMDSA